MQAQYFHTEQQSTVRFVNNIALVNSTIRRRLSSNLIWAWVKIKNFPSTHQYRNCDNWPEKSETQYKNSSIRYSNDLSLEQHFQESAKCIMSNLRSTEKFIDHYNQNNFEKIMLQKLTKLQTKLNIICLNKSKINSLYKNSDNLDDINHNVSFPESSTTPQRSLASPCKTLNDHRKLMKIQRTRMNQQKVQQVPKLNLRIQNQTARCRKAQNIQKSDRKRIGIKYRRGLLKNKEKNKENQQQLESQNKNYKMNQVGSNISKNLIHKNSTTCRNLDTKYRKQIKLIKQCLQKLDNLEQMSRNHEFVQKGINSCNKTRGNNICKTETNKSVIHNPSSETIILVPRYYQLMIL